MCTVSWVHNGEGYSLFANRDEKRGRVPSTAPLVHERDGVRFIAPMDGAFGGSWIACNELGVSVCLLNGMTTTPALKSRGFLVMDAASAESQERVWRRILRRDLSPFAAFTLIVIQAGFPAVSIEWDGRQVALTQNVDRLVPIASSSFDPEGVRVSRRHHFERMNSRYLNPDALRRFHSSHGSGLTAYSTCMHRADAQTVSLTEINVGRGKAELVYQPGAPCENRPSQTMVLELRS